MLTLRYRFGLLLAAVIVSPTPAATLISHYEFDGNNLNAVDGAPDATRLGGGPSTYVAGFDGTPSGAVFFSGSDDDVLSATIAGLPNVTSGLTSGSVSFWVQAEQQGDANILGTLNTGAATGFQIQLQGFDDENGLRFFIRDEDGDFSRHDEPLDSLRWDDGQWHHVAMTWDVSSGTEVTSSIYLDGVLVGAAQTDAVGIDNLTNYAFPMYIGSMNNRGATNNSLANGAIDDLRIYEGELTAAEVASLVPEPTSAVLLAGTVITMLIARRQRSSQSCL